MGALASENEQKIAVKRMNEIEHKREKESEKKRASNIQNQLFARKCKNSNSKLFLLNKTMYSKRNGKRHFECKIPKFDIEWERG